MDLGPARSGEAPRWTSGPVARNVVLRTSVLDRLDAATDQLVFLVCAPAGYGKSLSVASWLRDRRLRATWVTVRPGTTEGSLWPSILAEMLRTYPDEEAELTRVLGLIEQVPAEAPATLASWIRQRGRGTLLVLDDLHVVTRPQLHDQLLELIGAAGPDLHLVAISRYDPPWPLHRMRLDGVLGELRMDGVLFGSREAAELFESLGFTLERGDVDSLVQRTEGWAAGLRLAALGMREAADPGEYARGLSGRSDYIADYLMKEVYQGAPREWRDLLRCISVVDEVCPALASALGGGPDSGAVLAQMDQLNAFVDELGKPCWYRLHPLLLEFLRSRIVDDETTRSLHRKAAEWYVSQQQPLTALTHAIAGDDWAVAGELVGTHIVSWTVRRSPMQFLELLESIPREAILTDAGLAVGVAAARTMAGYPKGVDDLVGVARELVAATAGAHRRRLDFVLELVDGGWRRWTGDLQAVLDGFARMPKDPATLSEVGITDWASIRNLLISNQGSCELWLGDYDGARRNLTEAAADDLGRRVVLPILNAQAHLALLHWAAGDLTAAEAVAEEAATRFGSAGLAHAAQAAGAYLALAGVAFDRDLTGEASKWLDLAKAATGEPHMAFAVTVLRTRLQRAQGHVADSRASLEEALATARLAPASSTRIAASINYFSELDSNSRHPGGPPATRQQALEQIPYSPGGSRRDRVHVRLHEALDEDLPHDQRLDALAAALELAAAESLRRPFLDHGPAMQRLLAERVETGIARPEFALDLLARMAKTGGRRADPEHGFFVPLSERETNVLQYLIGSMTTAEIATALYVSVNTVKTHQRSIYQKLGATGRREAVSRARQLGLL
ncbi:LuxR C-terminal-related transcriptional regulator [Gordonia caeni]|uniref:LuxR C-terminal-related transcriptional regulator n=1 Tax=Gordonia caeni TaxID=1007097 RepID=A0ABP7NHF4_9ACTN